MEALNALVLKMVAGLDLKGFEKMKEDIYLLFADESYPDVKPDVDENLARKEDYEGVEKVKDDQDNVKFSEIKENDENYDKLKETEEVILIKYEDKFNETLVDEDEDEETLGIPQESSHKDSASSGIFFPEGCGLAAEGKPDPNKDPVEIDGNSNNEPECDMKDTITKAIGELENIKLVQSEVVVEEQVCFDIQNELKKSINDDDAATRMDEITDASIYDEDDDSLQVFEEGNDEIPKVEESYDSGYDDGNVQEVLVNNESVSTTGESFPNDTPESRLTSEIKVQHEFNEISEVLAYEPDNNEDKVKSVKENIENKEDLPHDSNTKEPIVKVIVTRDWSEAEKGVVEKCEELQTKLNLYTPDDIEGHYDEAEFKEELIVMKEAYSVAEKSIRELLRDYNDTIPTQIKEHWKRQASEIFKRLKSHERQLRAAVTRAKGNLSAPASQSSASMESNASEATTGKRKKALSKMKTLELAIENDAKELQEKIDEVSDWKLEDDVSVGRGMKKIEKWDEELVKIVQMMRDMQTLQREFDVDEGEIKCDEMDEVVNCLREDVKEVKRKIVNEDNERQLYSLDTTKVSKVNLPTFEGKDCEDFSKFKENIEKGFVTNRISRDEQIIKLRECLKGYARKIVPDSNVTDIKEAWRLLKLAFGNPIKIINQRKEALMKLGVKPKAKANLNTEIAWYIDLTTFLREIIDLGVKNPDYSELIFSNQFAIEIRQLFPHGRLKEKLRKCGGGGRSHLENMLELMNDWLENAQINQQENDIISRSAFAICRYSSGSSSTVSSGGSQTSLKVPENVDDSDDEEEEDFVDDRNTHESFGNISQQVRGANLVFMHVMPSFEFSEDYGNPSQTKSVTSLYKEKLVNANNEWEMNESVEELFDEEQEDLFEYQEVSFEESDNDEDSVDMDDDNHSAAFKEAVSKDTNVAKKELHDYDETSGMESDNKFNIVVKEDKILVCQETSDEELVKDNESVLENYEESTAKETDDKFRTEVDKEILNYVNETFEVMNEDLNDTFEVNEDAICNEENEIKVEHLNPDENADAALEDDEVKDQPVKSDVIKMLFKGTFSENAMEVLENLNKFTRINFGNRDANGLDAHFSSPENPSYTLVEEIDDKDSETESFQVSEVIKNQSEFGEDDLNVKAKEVETNEDVIEKCVLTLMYMHLFVTLPLLDAMLNMFMETNTELMKKVAQMVKMNGCCCASPSLLTGGERKDGGPYHAEETVTVCMSPTTLDSLNSFLAVNMDYTEKEEKPNYLASVDNPIMSIKSSRARDTALVSRGPFTRLDI